MKIPTSTVFPYHPFLANLSAIFAASFCWLRPCWRVQCGPGELQPSLAQQLNLKFIFHPGLATVTVLCCWLFVCQYIEIPNQMEVKPFSQFPGLFKRKFSIVRVGIF